MFGPSDWSPTKQRKGSSLGRWSGDRKHSDIQVNVPELFGEKKMESASLWEKWGVHELERGWDLICFSWALVGFIFAYVGLFLSRSGPGWRLIFIRINLNGLSNTEMAKIGPAHITKGQINVRCAHPSQSYFRQAMAVSCT